MLYLEQYSKWLSLKCLTPEERRELETLKNDAQELSARFGTSLAFGTAGLRGKMKLGANAMNIYTVAQATAGLAMYIQKVGAADRAVVIAYDSRNNSELFARTAAEVLAGNGIKVHIFDALRPTPELSFALRYLGCIAGINITASHNPKEYNGYKAYWDDGAQLSPDQANEIAAYMKRVDIDSIKKTDFDEGVASGIINIIGAEIDEKYLDAVLAQVIDLDTIKAASDSLNIVYTPLHGAGYRLVPEIISRIGIKHFHIVPEQAEPNGDFPTTKKPNPEYPEVFEYGIPLADRVGSDLIIATDPDADRVGIMVRGRDGKFIALNGNQTGSLLLDYIISSYNRSGNMPPEPYAVKSIVTTELMSKICHEGGVELYNVLTGFKYIGEVIKKKQAEGHGSFIFGAEESYGYLKGTYARDKDAVVATMLICEMTAYYKLRGMTLADALNGLYEKYGYSLEKTQELVLDDYKGIEQMKAIMGALRDPSIKSIAGINISDISDYLSGEVCRLSDGHKSGTGLPSSDVLRFGLENGDVIIVRPSGTEPKVKIYYLLSADNATTAQQKLERYIASVADICGQKV
ncbi:MAG: phospho-sugar mutase [Clostridia bacterium]|nr:phospho-sugar mutase [Clostridia bacterium]